MEKRDTASVQCLKLTAVNCKLKGNTLCYEFELKITDSNKNNIDIILTLRTNIEKEA